MTKEIVSLSQVSTRCMTGTDPATAERGVEQVTLYIFSSSYLYAAVLDVWIT